MAQQSRTFSREDAIKEAAALAYKASEMTKGGATYVHEYNAFIDASRAWSSIAQAMQPGETCTFTVDVP